MLLRKRLCWPLVEEHQTAWTRAGTADIFGDEGRGGQRGTFPLGTPSEFLPILLLKVWSFNSGSASIAGARQHVPRSPDTSGVL